MEKKTCIAMIPCPGHGHLIPLVEFAKRVVEKHKELHVKLLVPTLGSPTSSTMSTLNSLPQNIDFTILPEVKMEDLPPHQKHPILQIIHTITLSLPSIREALSSLKLNSGVRHVAVVLHLFSMGALHVAKQLNLSTYLFFSGATALSFSLRFPEFHQSVPSLDEFLDSDKTMDVPGCAAPLQVRDLPDLVLFSRSGPVYTSYLSVLQTIPLVDGILVNTFTELELDAVTALALQHHNNNNNNNNNNINSIPPVYNIGPIVQLKPNEQISESKRWLDNQPPSSVLYLCFGSRGTLTHHQLNEIAFGLELSGHKFLWVLRAPSNSANAGQEELLPLQYLPVGFLDRTKGQGLVLPNWAPQIQVLGHGSTGGFLSHCGWNSTLESVVHGVPMIAWPLFAEQRMNAILVEDVLKVAVRPKVDPTDGIVKREEVASVVKTVMGSSGDQMRKRMKDLSAAAFAALAQNGSSTTALSTVAHKWLHA